MRKLRLNLLGSVIALWTAIAGLPAHAQPLADKLPAHTLAYYGWTPNPAVEKTRAGQMLHDEQFMRAIRVVLQEYLLSMSDGNVAHDEDAMSPVEPGPIAPEPDGPAVKASGNGGGAPGQDNAKVAEQLPKLLDTAMKCQGCMAVLDAKFVQSHLKIEGVLLLKLGDRRKAFEESWMPIQAHLKLRLGDALKEDKRDNVHLFTWTIEGKPPLTWGFVEDLFICYSGDRGALEMPNLLGGHAALQGTLANTENFLQALERVQVSGQAPVVTVAYVDCIKALSLLRSALRTSPSLDHANPDVAIAQFFTKVGLDNVRAIAEKVTVEQDHFISRTLVHTDGAPHGLIASLVQRPVDDTMLKAVPADAMFMAAIRVDGKALFPQVRDAALALGGDDARKALDQMDVASQAVMGLIVDKALGSLGDQWVLYNAGSNGGMAINGWTLVASVRDAKMLEGILKTVAQQAAQSGGADAEQALHDEVVQGVTIHYLVAVPAGMDVLSFLTPSWALVDDRLIVAASPQLVEDAIRQLKDSRSILDDADFRATRQRVGNDGPIVFVSTPNLVRNVYPLGSIVAAEFRGISNAFGNHSTHGEDWSTIMPSQRHLLELVGCDAGTLKLTPDGILQTCSVANPALSVFNIPKLVLGINYVIWHTTVEQDNDTSPRAGARKNLMEIDSAAMLYAADHHGDFAPTLVEMLKASKADAEILKSPFGQATNGPTIVYSYFKGLSTEIPAPVAAEIILLYDASELERDEGTNVVYLDGHTEFIEKDNFAGAAALSKKHQAEIEKK